MVIGIVPCPNQNLSSSGHTGCCGNGHACVADELCSYPGIGAGGSGFYTPGCTDETYQDSACNQRCSISGPTFLSLGLMDDTDRP